MAKTMDIYIVFHETMNGTGWPMGGRDVEVVYEDQASADEYARKHYTEREHYWVQKALLFLK